MQIIAGVDPPGFLRQEHIIDDNLLDSCRPTIAHREACSIKVLAKVGRKTALNKSDLLGELAPSRITYSVSQPQPAAALI